MKSDRENWQIDKSWYSLVEENKDIIAYEKILGDYYIGYIHKYNETKFVWYVVHNIYDILFQGVEDSFDKAMEQVNYYYKKIKE